MVSENYMVPEERLGKNIRRGSVDRNETTVHCALLAGLVNHGNSSGASQGRSVSAGDGEYLSADIGVQCLSESVQLTS